MVISEITDGRIIPLVIWDGSDQEHADAALAALGEATMRLEYPLLEYEVARPEIDSRDRCLVSRLLSVLREGPVGGPCAPQRSPPLRAPGGVCGLSGFGRHRASR